MYVIDHVLFLRIPLMYIYHDNSYLKDILKNTSNKFMIKIEKNYNFLI